MSAPTLELGPVTVHFGARTGKYPDGNQVIVRGADATMAFDMPLVSHTLGPVIDEIDLVVLGHAHEDHQVGLCLVPDKPVAAPRGDVEAVRSWDGMARHYGYSPATLETLHQRLLTQFHFVERPDAVAYDDGATWDLGGGVRVRAHHMPGHTTGHSVLVVEPAGIAFIGDIDLTSFGPYYSDATSNLRDFRRSLKAVAQLPASAWITYHHKGVVQDRATFESMLAAYVAVLDRREAAILEAIGGGAPTFDDLRRRRFLYPEGFDDIFIDDAERRALEQHLDELVEQGRLALDDGRYRRT